MKNYGKIYADYYGIKWDSSLFEVHHIDRNRENNDIKNLVLIPKKLHAEYHRIISIIQYDFENGADIFNVTNYDIYHASEYQKLFELKNEIANFNFFQRHFEVVCINYKTDNYAELLKYCCDDIYKKYIGGKK